MRKYKLEEKNHREENEAKCWICKGGNRINVSKSRTYKIFEIQLRKYIFPCHEMMDEFVLWNKIEIKMLILNNLKKNEKMQDNM